MHYRDVLLEIRRRREQELEEFKIAVSKIITPSLEESESFAKEHACQVFNFSDPNVSNTLMNHYRAILTLELPFKIDTGSIGKALRKEPLVADRSSPKNIYDWINTGSQIGLNEQIVKTAKNMRPQARLTTYDLSGKATIHPPHLLPMEELQYVITEEKIAETITQKSLGPRSRDVRRSRFKNFWETIIKPVENLACLLKKPITWKTIEALATFYERCEQRCLKRHFNDDPLRAYRDLLEMRLLFYVSIPSTQLTNLTVTNIQIFDEEMAEGKSQKLHILNVKGRTFPLPFSFASLAHSCLTENDLILQKTIKKRNRFVENIVKAAKLEERITPKLIQQSLEFICCSEGYDKLSRR